MVKGVISDMDGVILDSEVLYVRFWCEAGRFYGCPFEERHALGIRSMARVYAIERLQGWFGQDFDYDLVRNKRVELMDKYVEQHGIAAKPGAETLLRYLNEKGIKTALATATAVDRAERYLDAVGLIKYFDEVCSARMVKNGKPAPDIYLYAAEKLDLPPNECIALEDSPNGIRSARYYNILFRFSLLENGAEDTCREKYLDPIYSRERIMPEYITPEHPLHAELEPLIRALTNDPHHQRFHDELLIKSRIFELMYRIFPTAKRQEKTLFMRTSYMKSYSAHLPFSRRTISKT